MRNLFILSALSLSLFATTAQAQRRNPPPRKPVAATPVLPMPTKLDLPGLRLGAANPLPELGVLDAVNSRTTALKSLAAEKGLVLIFISNTCNEVATEKKTIVKFAQQAKSAGLGVVYVNSNQRTLNELEGPPAMHEFALKEDIKEPYIIDQRMQIADVFGVQRLPEVFIFNADGYLAYRGAVEVVPAGAGKEAFCFACEALQNISNIGKIQYSMTAGKGCAIPPQE